MKFISKIAILFSFTSFLLMSCSKDTVLPIYATGNAPVLSSPQTTVAPTAADSNNVAVTFNWSNPNYATDSTNVKYTLELDSTGRNFQKSVKWDFKTARTKSITSKELNQILLDFGFSFNTPYGLDARITSSYVNNNDMKMSNVIKLTASAYKIPPKIALPVDGRLFLVGGGSAFGWSNSSTINVAEEFARVDETTWSGVFDLNTSDGYLILPVKGAWSTKFALDDDNVAGIQSGGDFSYYGINAAGGKNFKSVAGAGTYLITLNFQNGKFSVVPYSGPQIPTNLYMVGDATPGGWNNPATGASVQPLTRINSSVWEMPTIAITGGKEYLVLPLAGNWDNKYSVADNSIPGLAAGGDFGFNLSKNFPGPAVSGNYNFQLNFATAKFKTTKL